jgi:hypothetical protein
MTDIPTTPLYSLLVNFLTFELGNFTKVIQIVLAAAFTSNEEVSINIIIYHIIIYVVQNILCTSITTIVQIFYFE